MGLKIGKWVKRNVDSARKDIDKVATKTWQVVKTPTNWVLNQMGEGFEHLSGAKQQEELAKKQAESQERIARIMSGDQTARDEINNLTAEEIEKQKAKRQSQLLIGIGALLIVAIIGFAIVPKLIRK